jgi:hypothetical protein
MEVRMSSFKSVLPSEAYQKRIRLRAAADEIEYIANSIQRSISDIERQIIKTTDEKVEESLNEQANEMRVSLASHRERHRSAAALVARIDQWLLGHRGNIEFAMVPAPKVKGLGIDDLLKQIDDTRSEIASAKDELALVKRAPMVRPDIEKQVQQWVAEKAMRGMPMVKIAGAHIEVDFRDHAGGWSSSASDRLAAALAWLNPDAMTAQLLKQVNRSLGTQSALTEEERESRIAELTERLDDLERREEALIEAAIAGGHAVMRRVDASPSAVLGIRPEATDRVRLRAS